MDTSPQYRKMCERAKKIQLGHKLRDDDYVAYRRSDKYIRREAESMRDSDERRLKDPEEESFTEEEKQDIPKFREEGIKQWEQHFREYEGMDEPEVAINILADGEADDIKVWLPRIDQLQEMVWEKGKYDIINILCRFRSFIEDNLDYAVEFIMSWEKTWLAFVMLEKFKMKWDPRKEEWVDE